MPSLTKRSRSTPGCRNTSSGSRCHACQRDHQVERGTTTQRGYNDGHRRLRILAFQRDNWRCIDCGWQPQIVIDFEQYGLGEPLLEEVLKSLRVAFNRGDRHLHGEHIIPIDQRPDLRLSLENYATRCNVCHAAKTMRELKGPECRATPTQP